MKSKRPSTRLLEMLAGWSEHVAKEEEQVLLETLVTAEEIAALYQEAGQIRQEDLETDARQTKAFVEERVMPLLLRR